MFVNMKDLLTFLLQKERTGGRCEDGGLHLQESFEGFTRS